MNNLRLLIYLFVTVLLVTGCKKYIASNSYPVSSQQTSPKTPTQILTEKPWRLLSYGFDSNRNGVIDSNEESIRDCDKDNTYVFNKNGSGTVAENTFICNGNFPLNQFAWSLTNNDTVLDFYYGKANILQLTTDTLFIASLYNDEVKLLLVYGH